MTKNNYGGLLVAFDGPNGVGKSTLIEYVQAELTNSGIDVWVTKEPSDTILGKFTRQIAETLDGESLTCLVAADRYHHLNQGVIPQLQANRVVITDRYVLSSLILQRMDNVETDFILTVNDKVIYPDLQIVVTAAEAVIQSRLSERKLLTRFEQGQRTVEELSFLQEGKVIIANLGVQIIEIENSGSLHDNVSLIVKRVLEAMKK
jgi:dTMP kinase